MEAEPKDADDAFWLLKESLSWVSSLAKAYTKPFEKTLAEVQGTPLPDRLRAGACGRKEGPGAASGTAWTGQLAGLASLVTKREWPPSDLRAKLRKFEKDHPRLHKLLVRKLDELHRFHGGQ